MITPLSPIDYYFYRRQLYTIQFIFEFNGQIDIHQFQLALQKACNVFPIVQSRLHIKNSEIQFVFSPEPLPLRIVQFATEANLSLSHNEDYVDSVINAENEPLIKILMTQTPSKTLLGVSFSHMLGDGFSFFLFLKAISQAILSGKITLTLSNQRELLIPTHQASISPASQRLYASTGYITPRPANSHHMHYERFLFSLEELLAIKKEAEDITQSTLTINTVLMAFLLKKYYMHIPLTPLGELVVRCPVDYRRRYPGLPENYFGNAVCDAVVKFDPQNFSDLSLGQIATRINQTIQSIDKEYIDNVLRCLNDLRLENGLDIFENIGCPGLLVSNLSKLQFEDLNFGAGNPIAIHHASLNQRLANILPYGNGLAIKICYPITPVHNDTKIKLRQTLCKLQ